MEAGLHEAWVGATTLLPQTPNNQLGTVSFHTPDSGKLQITAKAVRVLEDNGLLVYYNQFVWETIQAHLEQVAVTFWGVVDNAVEPDEEKDRVQALEKGLVMIAPALSYWKSILGSVLSAELVDGKRRVTQLVQDIVFAARPGFEPLLCSFLHGYLTQLDASNASGAQIPSAHKQLWSILQGIGLSERWRGISLVVTKRYLEQHIIQEWKDQFREPCLPSILQWLNTVAIPFMAMVSLDAESDSQTPSDWTSVLVHHAYDTLGRLRIGELFDIILDYPDSLPAMCDLKACLADNTGLLPQLFPSLIHAFSKRLLQAGVSTEQIIRTFIYTIKCLAYLDSSLLLLSTLSLPIRSYLRERDDTVRCIVSSMTEDESSELFAELSRIPQDGEQEQDSGAVTWTPPLTSPSIDPLSGDKEDSRESVGIIRMVVGMYGGADVFIDQYQKLLALRLLKTTDYEIEKEMQRLELLQLRFGEGRMHNIDIMLQDMSNSKRINTLVAPKVRQSSSDALPVNATIVSPLFWPAFPRDSFQHVPCVQSALGKYSEEFGQLKASRKLEWVGGGRVGTVELELYLHNSTEPRTFAVTPLHASVVLLFQEQEKMTLVDVVCRLGTSEDVVRAAIQFWISQGVLAEAAEPATFCVASLESGVGVTNMVEDEDIDQQGNEEEDEAEWFMVENMVSGMLTNLGQLDAERIHMMLCMTLDGFQKHSLARLNRFLQGLVAKDKLSVHDGLFALVAAI
eukprot:TRINITY_DN385_c2_g1_i3.p1 TRINITY_DN385_c2_g1~~TRINITY_DN385_c2_g1_i3.p1  ORF type:complete len:738 (+),score=106.90 TRINITY_DN385_c2_g1_i3:2-2215(+)